MLQANKKKMLLKNIEGENSHLFACLRFVLFQSVFVPLSAFCAFGAFGACEIFS